MSKPLNAKQVGELLGFSGATIYAWANNGYIPAFAYGKNPEPKQWRFDKEEILEWQKSKHNKSERKVLPNE